MLLSFGIFRVRHPFFPPCNHGSALKMQRVLSANVLDDEWCEKTKRIYTRPWLNVAVAKKNKNPHKEYCDHSAKMNIVLIGCGDISNGSSERSSGIQNYSGVTAGQGEAAAQS